MNVPFDDPYNERQNVSILKLLKEEDICAELRTWQLDLYM